MKRCLLILFCAACWFAALPANAAGTQCLVGTAIVTNGAEDETFDVSVGLVWGIGNNLIFGPLGEAKEILPGGDAVVQTPNTEIPLEATFVDVYPSDSLYVGIYESSVVPCASASSAAAASPAFRDGRLVQEPWASATLYRTQTDAYEVWGIDAAGHGFSAFDFTCDEAQTRLRERIGSSAGGNILLYDDPVPTRGGSIQLWAVPNLTPSGDTRIDLVLVAPGQGGDNSKNTIVPLLGLCSGLQV